jgi:hypothetical protein
MKTAMLAVAAFAMLLAACASQGTRPTPESRAAERYLPYAGAPVERFTAFDIDGWTPISRTQLVVWARFNEAYLLTVWDNCQDMQFANGIGISRSGLAVSKFDYVQVGRDRCQITEIRPVDIRQMRADERARNAPAN